MGNTLLGDVNGWMKIRWDYRKAHGDVRMNEISIPAWGKKLFQIYINKLD